MTLNERKQALVRDTIWEAAIDLFAEKGFDETTMEDIATAAGTSRRSVFRYFASKSDFMAQAILSYGTVLMDAIRSCPATDSPGEILRTTLLSVAKTSAANPRTSKVMEIAAKYPKARQAQLGRLAEVQDQVAAALTDRFKRTPKEQITAQMVSVCILSLLGIAFHNWFEAKQPDIEPVINEVLATLREVAGQTSPNRVSKTQ